MTLIRMYPPGWATARRWATALAMLVILVILLASPHGPVRAQDWSFLGPLTQQTLDVRPGDQAPILFSDHPDPGTARQSLIFHYFESRTGGNAMGLNVGLFLSDAAGWRFVALLPIFGSGPREARFAPNRIEVTTTMPGPNDPRCCPTQVTRWSVDPATLQVVRVP